MLDIHIYSHIYIPPYNVPIKHLRRPSSGYQPMRDNFKLYKFLQKSNIIFIVLHSHSSHVYLYLI